ncbi:MAG: histidine triad nucleotide-binding protein [bacterium]
MANCIFCNIVARKVPANILYDDDHVVAFKDLNPQAPVHVLIVPKEHIATVNDLDANDHSKMGKLVHVAKLLAEKLGIAQKGFRLVLNCNPAGGQSVYHIHLHLLGGRSMRWPPG